VGRRVQVMLHKIKHHVSWQYTLATEHLSILLNRKRIHYIQILPAASK